MAMLWTEVRRSSSGEAGAISDCSLGIYRSLPDVTRMLRGDSVPPPPAPKPPGLEIQ